MVAFGDGLAEVSVGRRLWFSRVKGASTCSSCLPVGRVGRPALYPFHVAISAITSPYARSGLWIIYTPLYLVPRRRRVLDLTTASDTLALTKQHISEYSRFRLLLKSEAKCRCTVTASVPIIYSTEYTIGVKVRLLSIQVWRYLSFFSFSAVTRAFTDVWRW